MTKSRRELGLYNGLPQNHNLSGMEIALGRGQVAVVGPVVDAIATHWASSVDIAASSLQARALRDGNHFHISLIGKEECAGINMPDAPISSAALLGQIDGFLPQCPFLSVPASHLHARDVLDIGVGTANGHCFFVVIISPVLQWIRR